jgi:hypothetical protein
MLKMKFNLIKTLFILAIIVTSIGIFSGCENEESLKEDLQSSDKEDTQTNNASQETDIDDNNDTDETSETEQDDESFQAIENNSEIDNNVKIVMTEDITIELMKTTLGSLIEKGCEIDLTSLEDKDKLEANQYTITSFEVINENEKFCNIRIANMKNESSEIEDCVICDIEVNTANEYLGDKCYNKWTFPQNISSQSTLEDVEKVFGAREEDDDDDSDTDFISAYYEIGAYSYSFTFDKETEKLTMDCSVDVNLYEYE